MKNGEMVRQGDVILRKIAKLPERVQRHEPESGRIVVEYGEATGHAHTLDPQSVEAYDVLSEAGAIAGQAFRVIEATSLVHQEHGAHVLEPGIYERWYQVESDGEEERRVID